MHLRKHSPRLKNWIHNFKKKANKQTSYTYLFSMAYHENIVKKLDYFYENNKIPNIIIHGSSGTGKRTIVYDFLNKIYHNDKSRLKMNVMTVNCAHGKGIKFIREDLKFFAKTNIQSGVAFKSIVLLNADYLTIDAQSALRRCIELFSHNTRFFIVVENMNKLLNPILSRFCAIYVPECLIDGKIVNLHHHKLEQKYPLDDLMTDKRTWLHGKLADTFAAKSSPTTAVLSELAGVLYERGYSCLDVIAWLKEHSTVADAKKAEIVMHFHNIRKEYRCEKMLMFYVMMEIIS